VRCDCTSSAVAGEEGVETLMISRLVVVGVMPKRRKDSAICFGVRWKQHEGGLRTTSLSVRYGSGEHTLLFGEREKTISECTFRLRNLFSNRSFTAR
jgi:hypothetical protein